MSSTSNIDLKSVKRRKIVLGLTVLGGIIGFSMITVWLTSSEKKDSLLNGGGKPKVTMTNIAAPGEQIKPSDVWRAMSEARMNNVETQSKETASKNKVLTEDIEKLKKELRDNAAKSTAGRAPNADQPPLPPGSPLNHAAQPGNVAGPARYNPSEKPQPGRPGAPNGKPTGDAGSPHNSSGIATVSFSDAQLGAVGSMTPAAMNSNNGTAFAGINKTGTNAKPRRTVEHYIPSGSFTPALVLGGIDAPAGGQAAANPQPVLLMLKDRSILPNKYRYDAKQCHVLGAGYGDINSERAYIRLESLSCVLKDGTVIDVAVKGYVADETGKTGMKGRVVTKTGQVLSNALLVGIAGGIGKAFAQSANTVSVSPLGSTTTVDPNKIAQAGLGNGVESAMDRLANYYIKLADQLFPIIEVDAGRTVDVVFSAGVDLGKAENQQAQAAGEAKAGATTSAFSPRPQQTSLKPGANR
jgi:conjugal transfer pilus assembly protein TraB